MSLLHNNSTGVCIVRSDAYKHLYIMHLLFLKSMGTGGIRDNLEVHVCLCVLPV